MKSVLYTTFAIILVVMFSGCAHSPNVSQCMPEGTHIYGFWAGTWHGTTMWFSLIGSIFDDTIKIYAVNNDGFWYDFGFVGGIFLPLKALNGIIKSYTE